VREKHDMKQSTEESSLCLNCHSSLPGDANYCLHCGQKTLHPHDRSVRHLVFESVGDFFHLDSKFFATLWPLAFRPGFLTAEYLEGRRQRYFQPFKLFLFISFLFFLTAGLLNHQSHENEFDATGMKTREDTTKTKSKTEAETYKLHMDKAYVKILKVSDDSLRKMITKYGLNVVVYLYFPNESGVRHYIVKQVVKNRLKETGGLAENMSKTLPKLVFILIPFFALLLSLIYRKRKIAYFDHIIFSLHFLSFYFLLFWLKEIVSPYLGRFNVIFSLLLIIYLFMALQRVYRQTLWATLAKFCLLVSGTLIILGIFFTIAAVISFVMI
jgi:hypothetical protein